MIARIIALLLIILLSPLLILISITIFIEDGFPIIYKQVNLGKNHKTFTLFKFRTMLKNTPLLPTEEMNDSNKYLLKSGHFLRKYSLAANKASFLPSSVKVTSFHPVNLFSRFHTLCPCLKSIIFINALYLLEVISQRKFLKLFLFAF